MVPIILTFLSLIVPSLHALTISYTDAKPNRQLCMTDCRPNQAQTAHYCYWGWGQDKWDYCTPGIIPALEYKTAKYHQTQVSTCSSLCGTFGETDGKNWCYLNGDEGGGAWDYCSTQTDVSITGNVCTSPCGDDLDTPTPETVCIVNGVIETCSPPPDATAMNKALTDILVSKRGGYFPFLHFVKTTDGVCQVDPHPRSWLKLARVDDEEVLREYGVENFATVLELTYANRIHPGDPDNPITEVTWEWAPHRTGMNNVQLAYVIRATIRPEHLQNRTDIPSWVTTRMRDMDYLPGRDERGHLVAASLGGPTTWYNFAPQTQTVNRNVGYGGQRAGGSWWFRIEEELRTFLRRPDVGYIDWVLVLTYGDLNLSRRPTGFGLILYMYDNNGNFVTNSGDMFFDNDPDSPNSVC
ncbi:hypothetical protein Fcan01_11032 [Folsomia candida]|uniref:Uncharacterized protein n=1 Tax=Folsomia candida TaxID=158441 RepID=A0A226E7T9_FOLCA|nr:hypothetical protein Fcan01_11032 [Folsomia candida]